MKIITSTINSYVYIENLDNFLIPLMENWLKDDEIIFQDNYASYYREKWIKVFPQKSHIKSMIWPVNSSARNPIENVWWKFSQNGLSEGSIHQRSNKV